MVIEGLWSKFGACMEEQTECLPKCCGDAPAGATLVIYSPEMFFPFVSKQHNFHFFYKLDFHSFAVEECGSEGIKMGKNPK